MSLFKMKLVWVVYLSSGQKIIWENFKEAFTDYEQWDNAVYIYPKIMSLKKFNSLKEFTGL